LEDTSNLNHYTSIAKLREINRKKVRERKKRCNKGFSWANQKKEVSGKYIIIRRYSGTKQ